MARVFSGIQPTADSLHLGNWLGALRQWVELQDEHDCVYCVVDLHAITVEHDVEALRRRTRVTAAQLLAVGVDPERSVLFVQSHVPTHPRLAWVLGCLTGFGEASRMTQFKDKAARDELGAATVGLFTYPVLQAADVLGYRGELVPVGEDQRQHLELMRDLAQRFNSRYGDTFPLPQPHVLRTVARSADLQEPTRKMSKSASSPRGIVDLLDEPGRLRKKVRGAVTDTGTEVRAADDKPGISNLLQIYAAVTGRGVADVEAEFVGQQYGTFKSAVAEVLVEALTPIRERTQEWLESPERLDAVLADGAARAEAISGPLLDEVHDRLGLVPRPAGA